MWLLVQSEFTLSVSSTVSRIFNDPWTSGNHNEFVSLELHAPMGFGLRKNSERRVVQIGHVWWILFCASRLFRSRAAVRPS